MWRFADRLIDGFIDDGSLRMGRRTTPNPSPSPSSPTSRECPSPTTHCSASGLSTVHQADHPQAAGVPLRAVQRVHRRPAPRAAERHPHRAGDRDLPRRFDCRRSNDAALIAANLFVGGQETTVRLLSFALRMLGRASGPAGARARRPRPHPQLHRGDAAPRESAADSQFRMARVRTTLGGVDIPAGGTVMLVPGACNRDPRVFENPYEFDIERPNARQHIAFGHGIHTCAGAPLARAEGRVTINRFLDRTADIRSPRTHHGPAG